MHATIKPSLNVRKEFVSEGDLNPEIGEISLNPDLTSKTGEKSPDRGVHAAIVASAALIVSSEFEAGVDRVSHSASGSVTRSRGTR